LARVKEVSYNNHMKIYFFGTPEFSVPSLRALAKDKFFEILKVVTQPDKEGNRRKVTPPPVKIEAEKLGLKITQPEKIDEELIKEIENNKPDAIIVVAYGEIIPKKLINIPKFGCINIHPSLLPKYRGASPIQETLLNGDKETGVAIMKIDEQLDHGGVFVIKRVPIEKSEDYTSLSIKLSEIASVMIPFVLKDIANHILTPLPQNDSKATFCKKISKENGKIDFNKPAEKIINKIQALNPWPSTYFELKGKRIKILKAGISNKKSENKPGTAEIISKDSFAINTKDFQILPIELQIEGKPPAKTKEFLNGYKKLLEN
jgi:methionyl-tRNA formyltransferase